MKGVLCSGDTCTIITSYTKISGVTMVTLEVNFITSPPYKVYFEIHVHDEYLFKGIQRNICRSKNGYRLGSTTCHKPFENHEMFVKKQLK